MEAWWSAVPHGQVPAKPSHPLRFDGSAVLMNREQRCAPSRLWNVRGTRGDSMRVTATAVTFNVDDVHASSRFLIDHFGFWEKFTTEDLASMAREDVPIDVVFLRRGMDVLPEDQRETHAAGMILAFTVEDLEGELARLEAEGVTITMPFTVDP